MDTTRAQWRVIPSWPLGLGSVAVPFNPMRSGFMFVLRTNVAAWLTPELATVGVAGLNINLNPPFLTVMRNEWGLLANSTWYIGWGASPAGASVLVEFFDQPSYQGYDDATRIKYNKVGDVGRIDGIPAGERQPNRNPVQPQSIQSLYDFLRRSRSPRRRD